MKAQAQQNVGKPKAAEALERRDVAHEQRGRMKGGSSQDWLPHTIMELLLMRHHHLTFPVIAFLALTGVSRLHAQAQSPVIRANSVVNAASHISPGLPNYGVAQGSMFIVRGQGLASGTPQQITSGNSPLPTTLAGASMQITVAGAKVDVPMVYAAVGMFGDFTGPYDELAGIVPPTTAASRGTVQFTVH